MWPTPLHPGVGHPCPGAANESLEPGTHTETKPCKQLQSHYHLYSFCIPPTSTWVKFKIYPSLSRLVSSDNIKQKSPPKFWGQSVFLTIGVLQRVSCFLTPSYRVQIRAVCLHPVVVLRTPAIKMNLEGKRGFKSRLNTEEAQAQLHRESSCTFRRWSSVSTMVATRINMGFLLSTASTFIPIWKPCGGR